uniref:Thiamin biosynthesis protein S n=1 Tax=Dichotomaria marginata TaxID=268567 RepID=A0A1G4NSP8_9FLOR|nr:Thiamin biosynthesis protein S [Dichotomaria marginata]SCW21644.1 Thiamin biosynthesis protein S [Dichotomaria marginata]
MQNQYFSIQVNGEPFYCSEQMSIEEILIYLNISIELNLVEYNQEIIPNDQLSDIFVKKNDKLEIITIVGGG